MMSKKYNAKPEQAKVLKELEKIIGKSIPQVEEIKELTFGVKIVVDNIVGLGFYNRQLSTLPETIGNLKSLQELYLSDNKLTTLPESISNLSSLQALDLRNSKLTTLPESIGCLESLQTLDLNGNKLSSLPESIGNLSSLEELQLYHNELTTLPESIGSLKSLQELDLSWNWLWTLPESISKLTSLKNLDLGSNKLTTLPESITKLEALQELDLSNNKLTTLPESIRKLESLQKIKLDFNQFTTPPESISKLKSLQELDLSTNKLTTLPESIGNLESLQALKLSRRELTTIPESISSLASLQTLSLQENLLTTLPESIGNLTSLKNLHLTGNKLTTIPESISSLASLQTLNLQDNLLTTLPESFSQLKSLKNINLGNNDWKGEWQEMAKNDVPTILRLCRKLNGINIFISHAMKDQEDYPIFELNKYLEKCEEVHDVHLCEEDLKDSIQAFMDKNVPKSQLLIFVGTENSLTSKDCLYELSLAKKFSIKILPIKGTDISREDLKQVDLREHEQDFIDLSKLEGFEFNAEIFDKLHEYITSHESELKLFKKEQEKLDTGISNMRKIVMDFADSNEFKEHLKENFEEFQKIFQDVRNDRITTLEYILKFGQTIEPLKRRFPLPS